MQSSGNQAEGRRSLEARRFQNPSAADDRPGHEFGAIHKDWRQHHRIALVYPNTYPIGMTNLGLQRMYQALNDLPGFLCERFFLDEESEGTPRSCESGRALREFDCVAFSVSFETDYVNVLKILAQAEIPLTSAERSAGGTFPFILGGGCGITVNPEPLADFFDVICLGEGDDFIEPFSEVLRKHLEERAPRESFLECCLALAGAYVPSFYDVEYAGTRVSHVRALRGAPEKVTRLIRKDLNTVPTHTVVVPVKSPFRDMYMVETGRGCQWACRFCAAGYVYRYPRERALAPLQEAVQRGLDLGMRIGLVGSDMSCHAYIWDLLEFILDQGGNASLSSIRVEAIDDRMAKLIARTGIKTMTLAPDAGSFRLRRVLNKNMPDEMIVDAAGRLLDAGIQNIKLYFIIGLPTEGMEDIDALIELARKVRSLMKERAPTTGRMGVVSISINPFIPKPGTPFQWGAMEPESVIQERFHRIRKALVPEGNFKIELESYRGCYLQAFFSRGDRRAGKILRHMLETGRSVDRAAKDLAGELSYVPEEQINRQWGYEETLPWQIVGHGFTPDYLQREMERGFQTKLIPNCAPETCRLCGICG